MGTSIVPVPLIQFASWPASRHACAATGEPISTPDVCGSVRRSGLTGMG
jgi:hypothetical protein